MSLMKWALAMAGTAVGLRYLSARQRKRITADGTPASGGSESDSADAGNWRTDRDSSPSDDARSAAPLGGIGTMAGMGATAAGRTDDLLSPGSDPAPGSSAPRF